MTNQQPLLAINLDNYQAIITSDFQRSTEAYAKSGIFINPGHDKGTYIKLQKLYHPDIFAGDKAIATVVSQAINAAKDGSHSYSFQGSVRDRLEEMMRQWKQETKSRIKYTEAETRSFVPNSYYAWFKVDKSVWEYRIGYNVCLLADIDLGYLAYTAEMVVPEKEVTHVEARLKFMKRSALLRFNEINWSALKKDDLKELLNLEDVHYFKSWNKTRLIDALKAHAATLTLDEVQANNYTFKPFYVDCLQLHDILKTVADPMITLGIRDKARERWQAKQEERIEQEEKQYGKCVGASDWLRQSGKGYLGKTKFTAFVRAAQNIAMSLEVIGDVQPGEYTKYPSAIWERAYDSITSKSEIN
jgi:hypothetical protein